MFKKKNQIDFADQMSDMLKVALLREPADINEVDVDNVLTGAEKKDAYTILDLYMIAVVYLILQSDQQAGEVENLKPRSTDQEDANRKMGFWLGYYTPIVLSQKIGKEAALNLGESYVEEAVALLEEALEELEGKRVADSEIFFALAGTYAKRIIPNVATKEDGYRQHVVVNFATQIYRRLSEVHKISTKGSKLVYSAPQSLGGND